MENATSRSNANPSTLASCWLACALLLVSVGTSWAHGLTRYENGRWFDGETFVERVVYSDGGVLTSQTNGPVDRTVDLEGGYVVPAFGNAHTHALADGGYQEQIAEFLRRGVFYTANPNNIPRLTDAVRPTVNVPGSVAVAYSNGGITGPGGHPIQIYDSIADGTTEWSREDMNGQAYHVIDSLEDLDRVWPLVEAGRPDFIKVYLEVSEEHEARRQNPDFYGRRGLDPALLPAIVGRAHAAGLRVVAHVTSRADVVTAIDSKVDAIAHLPLERLDPSDARRAAEQGTVFMTTVLSHRSTGDVTDIEAVHRFNLQLLRQQRVALVLGTDSHRSLLDEIDEVARLGGFSAAEMLRLACRETPRWIFPERPIGGLSDGNDATFLVLDDDPLEDLAHLRRISIRVQRGHELQIEAKTSEQPPIAREMVHELRRNGIEAALAFYDASLLDEPDAWDFSEQQLNGLGYQLIQHGQSESAVRIFELNAVQFPDSANVYDSLGEGLMNAGRLDEAIHNYTRSLELNSHNDNAREKLEEIRLMVAAGD